MHQTHTYDKPQVGLVIAAITMLSITALNTAHASTANTYQLSPTNNLTNQVNLHTPLLTNSTPRSNNRQRSHNTTASQTIDPKLIGKELFQSLTQQHGTSIARGSKSANRISLITTAQQENLKALNHQLQSTGGVKVSFHKTSGTPIFIKPKGTSILPRTIGINVANKAGKKSIAMNFLNENRALLKLEDPVNELMLINQKTDQQGKTHFRFQQTINNIPVWGKQALVHLDKTSGVYLFQGNYEPTLAAFNTTPEITASDAIAITLLDLEVSTPLSIPADSELTVYIKIDGSPILSFKVEITPSMEQRWIYFIDAETGAITHKINNIHKNVVEASGIGLDGENKTFNAWHHTGENRYYLIDPSTPTLSQNADPVADGPQSSGDTYIFDAQQGDGSSLYYSTNSTLTNWLDPIAVDAAYHTRQVYNYYLNAFGRNSIDGNNKNLMVVINYGQNVNNAFWNGTSMVYGNGDNLVFSPLAGCLDVAAHEMTHGVIESTANLIYENQSGALNESFADVFGVMIDNSDWLIGEDCTIASPGHLRSMKNPASGLSSQPAHMDEYQNLPNTPEGNNGGVHVNSGIPNRAAYLIAKGLTAEGLGASIGRAATAQIYYRALTTYLTQSSQFIDARLSLIQAAEDIFDVASTQALAVAAAFDAVGITEDGATPPTSGPTPTDPVAGNDVMVYLYPEDGTHDSSTENFFLYTQVMDDPFAGYNNTTDFGPFNDPANGDLPAYYTKPAIFTNSTGTYFYYVARDNNVYLAVPSAQDIQMTSAGGVYSIATSPDGRYVSYTSIDNHLYVVDFENGGAVSAYPIIPPNYQSAELADNSILFADAMSFDYTSSTIVFDALNCLSTPNSACVDGAGYRFWSIGIFDLNNNQFFFPIASQNPDIDLGHPSFAANNNFVITMDLHDYSSGSDVASSAIAINFEEQETKILHDFGSAAEGFWSIPSFWGDDNYATIQTVASGGQSGGISASRIAVDTNWQGSGNLEAVNDFAVAMPIMHRAGVRTLSGTLTPSATILDFGTVITGTSSQLTLTLANTGNSDVNITGFSLHSGNFSHNGINTRVPRNSEVTITVTYTAGETSGTEVSTFNVELDNQSALAIALTATANTPTTSPPASGGGGGTDPLSLALVLLALFLTRVNTTYSTKYRRNTLTP